MKHSQRPHILYVEDDADTREIVSVILARADYKVTSAETYAESIQLAKTDKCDLYLIDNILPDGSGFSLCEQLRSFDSKTPIVFCPGASTDENKRGAAECGAQGYLVKPFDSEELLAEIRRVLGDAGYKTIAEPEK